MTLGYGRKRLRYLRGPDEMVGEDGAEEWDHLADALEYLN